MKSRCSVVLASLLAISPACTGPREPSAGGEETMSQKEPAKREKPAEGPGGAGGAEELATFGAGCFWCVEAVLQQLPGVLGVASGYMGGQVVNPTYEQVCSGRTGHAEVVQVRFDPRRISYDELLDYFWRLHDPTTLNRQGNDTGTQYRSAIFYHSEAQREAAEKSRQALEAAKVHASPIVTEIVPAAPFYQAEDYHQDYYRQNRSQGYCRIIIAPKLEKLGLEK